MNPSKKSDSASILPVSETVNQPSKSEDLMKAEQLWVTWEALSAEIGKAWQGTTDVNEILDDERK